MFHFLFPWLLTCFHAMVFFFASKESDMICEIHLLLLKTLFENLENQLSCLCKGYHDLHTHVWVVSRFDSPLY
jgi:hypothetical protein